MDTALPAPAPLDPAPLEAPADRGRSGFLRRHAWLALVGFVGVNVLIGTIAGLTTASSVGSWYQTLDKPFWTPPDWLFGPVWTALYVLVGVSAFLVWRRGPSPRVTGAMKAYILQMTANALWAPIFFGLRDPSSALIDLILMVVFLMPMIGLFWQVRRAAGLLLVPYALWVGYALSLNAGIVFLNSLV